MNEPPEAAPNKSVCASDRVYSEDVSQNPLKCSKRPKLLKIGLISKSLLNKRQGKKCTQDIYLDFFFLVNNIQKHSKLKMSYKCQDMIKMNNC